MGERCQRHRLRRLRFFHLLVMDCFQSSLKTQRGDILSFFPAVLTICFHHSSVSKESACNAGILPRCRRPGFNSWVWKIPWKRKWQLTLVFLPGKSHGQRSWWATVHRLVKSQTWLKWLSMHALCYSSLEKQQGGDLVNHNLEVRRRDHFLKNPSGLKKYHHFRS